MAATDRSAADGQTAREFPAFRFAGTHRQLGRQYGESCGDLIARHLVHAFDRLTAMGGDPDRALAQSSAYRSHVAGRAPWLDEEIRGVAEGADLSLEEAYVLQLRAELLEEQRRAADTDGCTTFAILPDVTADGIGMAGQNADLPAFYSDIGVVVNLIPDDAPEVLIWTPAGQVSYIGLSATGMAAFGNFLYCGGWRTGFPRYLLTRMAMTCRSVTQAADLLDGLQRASSRNVLLLDGAGDALDLETTPSTVGRVHPSDGVLTHTNHFIADEVAHLQDADASSLADSRARLDRIRELIAADRGHLTLEHMKRFFGDRHGVPRCLSRHVADGDPTDVTVASVIARPAAGTLHVAVGPPDEHRYVDHRLQSTREPAR
ncbi:hypothetical protein BH20ACT8_BH20ACT8_02130 [soil metagenome]